MMQQIDTLRPPCSAGTFVSNLAACLLLLMIILFIHLFIFIYLFMGGGGGAGGLNKAYSGQNNDTMNS